MMSRRNSPLDAAVEGERSLTARSVLASALLGSEPPELPVARLVALAGLFAVNANRARVALSRMAAAGEVVAVGDSTYRLAGALLERQERQRSSLHPPVTTTWQGGWTLAVVTATGDGQSERAARRRALARARFAEWREGVWIRPDNLPTDALRAIPGVERVDGHLAMEPSAARALVTVIWPLDAWATRADDLVRRLALVTPAISTGDAGALAPGFVVSAAVLRHLQADPLLPHALEPDGWPGHDLRDRYGPWDAAYRELLRHWHRDETAQVRTISRR